MGRTARNDRVTAVDARDLQQEIRERSYELFLRRSEHDTPGDALSDWVTGEAQVVEAVRNRVAARPARRLARIHPGE
jgi:hypothetical protein